MAVNPDGIPICFYCCAPVNKHLDDCAYTQRFRPRCPECGVPSPAHLGNCPTLSQVGLLHQKIALLESKILELEGTREFVSGLTELEALRINTDSMASKIDELVVENEDLRTYIAHLKDHIHQVRTGQIPLRRLES